MGVVVMALIPQQTARTVITSQMLVNLSESLGYKTPSKASTGLFVASFLGLGQLGFLFLTGSTTSLIAWGLLPTDVRRAVHLGLLVSSPRCRRRWWSSSIILLAHRAPLSARIATEDFL